MTEIGLLRLGHLLGLVYWLGADLGVFYSSYLLCDERQPPVVRVAAGKILFALDQAPRISMTLMLPLGVHLAVRLGYVAVPENTGNGLIAGVWLLAAAWLGMVLALHFRGHGGRLAWLARLDFGFRAVLALVLLGVAAGAVTGLLDGVSAWAGWKLGVFGGLVLCGLAVRLRLRPFGPAFAALARGEAGAAENAVIRRSIGGTRPFVLAIWAGLLVNTALGLHLL